MQLYLSLQIFSPLSIYYMHFYMYALHVYVYVAYVLFNVCFAAHVFWMSLYFYCPNMNMK